jgi:prophage antirepressor-like protein
MNTKAMLVLEPSQSLQQVSNPFQFGEHPVRTAFDGSGEIWFCAKDVFEALGVTWSGRRGSLKNYQENWQVVLNFKTSGGVKETIFLSEPGVWKTIFLSRKPQAEAFANWICEDVLPALRRQGAYGSANVGQRVALSRQINSTVGQLTDSHDALEVATLTRELRDLCNLAGRPMPDIALLGRDPKQLPLQLARS